MPSWPAPASVQRARVRAAAVVESGFTFQQQVQDWGHSKTELNVTMPPLNEADVAPWITFLEALDGPVNVFQFSSAFVAKYPALHLSGVYFRLRSNSWTQSLGDQRYYGLVFEIREAI